ncbi:Imm50 family immunity protein [Streptomyces sp. NPDC000229]|uniref:Imm50 family immunity protein n=1 Tax=Streptomyces sp. NPDC000229 TaxID=3154247 RepID=UPI003332A829
MTDNIVLVNSDDLLNLYGEAPPLGQLRLRSLNMDWRGPTVTLRVDLSSFPAVVPQEWQGEELDTVQCHLQFLAVEDFSLAEWEPPVASASFRVQPLKENRRIRVRVTGAGVALEFTSNSAVQVGHVSAFKISPDGTDRERHIFLKKLDRLRYEFIPGTEEKTFYGRI